MPVALGLQYWARGAVAAAQPIHVAAGPPVWWPRGAGATLESPGL